MGDGFQGRPLGGVGEDDLGQGLAVDRPVRPAHTGPEVLEHGLGPALPGASTSRATWSASMTAAPRAASALPTVDFPLPRDPLRPTNSTPQTYSSCPPVGRRLWDNGDRTRPSDKERHQASWLDRTGPGSQGPWPEGRGPWLAPPAWWRRFAPGCSRPGRRSPVARRRPTWLLAVSCPRDGQVGAGRGRPACRPG